MTSFQRRCLFEVILIWASVILSISLLYQARFIPFIGNNLPIFTSVFLIYAPTLLFILKKEPVDFFEKNWNDFFYSIKIVCFLSLIVFPVILVGNHFFQIYIFHFQYRSVSNAPLLNALWFHLFLVAFPEEFFFRGYFLKRMRQIFQDRFSFLGVPMGKAFFATAIVFALSHSLIVLRWWHAAIFFPALAFGWLKDKTKGLTAPILFHAFCNLFSTWVGLHYR